MKPPCEIIVWYIIPAIRSEVTKELLNRGMTQKKISELLEITQPAVSQYLRDKRGHGLTFSDKTYELINDLADGLFSGKYEKKDLISKTCEICATVKLENVVCNLHKDKESSLSNCHSCK
ncbi:conserved hypothetical protein [Methanococcus vannielii SB]|jgi:predicted transcriptional regulator|uniref:HTH cro/C1-type domain-containing protein n=1 Tax=Methanococcus vannielii (strain ATCC 35089 / DSM 1224 / JCM 13029 / OCM 148 / SB) TaxID=406327 RepID=A6UNL5_METVS|nr:ArsR family transcriptional regulator [Methanococcus vannielii]ABR54087.1 conserved hypothetical protein [Methanococcus vannielii SB]